MKQSQISDWRNVAILALILCLSVTAVAHAKPRCDAGLTDAIPSRSAGAQEGTEFISRIATLGGADRDAEIEKEVLAGNIPGYLRRLVPVRLQNDGVEIVICVTPDYLAIGDDHDFVRTPIGLPTAAKIAEKFGFFLPTTAMVDAIYSQARFHLSPAPMNPTNEMTSTAYFATHNTHVEAQLARLGALDPGELTAGQKKDLVFAARLRRSVGKVAIYGWHHLNGKPIQPFSTVHGAQYADYSHGVRLVSATAFVDGKPVPLAEIMEDPVLAPLVSAEGPIERPRELLASLHR